jgi:SAM-dependent methyltransferase
MSDKNPKDIRRMYHDLAWAWPLISPPEDYIKEAKETTGIIRTNSEFEPHTLLHLGCGGGHVDFTLKNHFKITGVDLSDDMLGLARNLNPDVDYLTGDMRTVSLERLFDAVIILDSIAYMLSEDDLRAAFSTAHTHLRPGGIFLTYAERLSSTFKQNHVESYSRCKGDYEITLIEQAYDPNPSDTVYESTFVYLMRKKEELRIETDRHLAGLFPLETWTRILEEVGFSVNANKDSPESSCVMFVCRKPS